MGDDAIAQLRSDVRRQLQIGAPRQMMADSSYRSTQGTMQVLRIHGPVLSRPSWLSQLLGLRTTEEHLDNLSSLLSSGDDDVLLDSVGGDANLAFEFADMIRSGGDRVKAYSGGYAASAGMLFLTAASKSFAHRSATLGAIGVVGYANFADDPSAIYSDNAGNKRPNKQSVLRDINATEQFFLEYVSTGTGLSQQQVVARGNQGDIFSGQAAVDNGFINGTTTLQDLTTGRPDQQTQQMAQFVATQMKLHPNITAEQMLSNYLSLHPTTAAPAKQQQSEDDWQARLDFMKTGISKRTIPARPITQPTTEQRTQCQSVTGGDWESRLEFIRTKGKKSAQA
jgi:ClpP class serine protease